MYHFNTIYIIGGEATFQILSPEQEEIYSISAKPQIERNTLWAKDSQLIKSGEDTMEYFP